MWSLLNIVAITYLLQIQKSHVDASINRLAFISTSQLPASKDRIITVTKQHPILSRPSYRNQKYIPHASEIKTPNDDDDNNNNLPPSKDNDSGSDTTIPPLIGDFVSSLSSSISTIWKYNTILPSSDNKDVQDRITCIISLCDEIDDSSTKTFLEKEALQYARYNLLQSLMIMDYESYLKTVNFLSPSRIPRDRLPNVQDLKYIDDSSTTRSPTDDDDDDDDLNVENILESSSTITSPPPPTTTSLSPNNDDLVPDCTLPNATFAFNPLDTILLSIFRNLVEKNSNGIATSSQPGMKGLLEQGRTYMLSGATPEEQHTMVRSTLRGLMLPIVPVYRLFMAGIVPDWILRRINNNPDKYNEQQQQQLQLGPLFYAPYLTSVVTPPFFSFLVGPSRPNARKDGRPGGLLVEKCQFLQESNCKGLCLHQCKIPAQEFFREELGVSLTVSPNFETQECQWSFGEEPLPYDEDPSFPKGCLVGCGSRKLMNSESDVVVSSCG